MEIKKKRFIRPVVTVMTVQTQSLLQSSTDIEGLSKSAFVWNDGSSGAKGNNVDWESGDLN